MRTNMKGAARKGFTLPELLLAAAILAFVLCGLLVLFINCVFLNEANRNSTVALSHAQYVMEDIKNTNFYSIKTKIDNGDWDWATAGITARGLNPLPNESIDTSRGSTDNPLEVAVTVTWQDRRQRNRQAALRTLFAK